MTELVTISGLVATTPRHLITQDGLPITSFRLASSQRRFDREQNKWIDGETNWFTITGFRQLAINLSTSVQKGERIIVTGRLKIRDWDNGERAGTSVEVEAEHVGHDLFWGTSVFTRTVLVADSQPEADEEFEPELELAGQKPRSRWLWMPELSERPSAKLRADWSLGFSKRGLASTPYLESSWHGRIYLPDDQSPKGTRRQGHSR